MERCPWDGILLRLWVNPKEKRKGVEPLVKENIPPETKRDYHKIAAHELEKQFGEGLDSEEMRALTCSVVKQWQQHEGHACLFIDRQQQLAFKLTEHDDGTCDVVARSMSVDLGPLLSLLGFPPEVHSELIARLNLGQEIEFRDRKGVLSRLWHDPKARRIRVQPVDLVVPALPDKTPPVLCPKCTAVLRLWRKGERQQTCPLCGHTISLC